jgi:hypothetical protein
MGKVICLTLDFGQESRSCAERLVTASRAALGHLAMGDRQCRGGQGAKAERQSA